VFASSAVRQLVGRPDLADAFPLQPPVSRDDMTPSVNPVGRAYEQLIRAVRAAAQTCKEWSVSMGRDVQRLEYRSFPTLRSGQLRSVVDIMQARDGSIGPHL